MADILEPRCGCDDCESAVSPGAYLATLLDYVLKHVRNNGAKIDLAYLDARFQQPFSALPMDCEAMEKPVRHVRLAVEVLRAELGSRPLVEHHREAALAIGEADYRMVAYMRLLSLLGTTYEELRRARSASADERQAIAARLGIDLTPGPVNGRQDELDLLLLDPALAPTEQRSLTERSLERLFGLADTGRDRLSEGVKYGDTHQQFVRWNVDHAYWSRNTDSGGMVYLDLYKNAPDSFAVRVFSDRARSQVVASGERKTEIGPIRLVPANGSRLSGQVEINYQADTNGVSLSAVPALLGWRLRHLRTLWTREDWPAQPTEGSQPLLPLIDPQVIGLGELRHPHLGETAFDLWLARYRWLANQRQALKVARETASTALGGMEAIVAQALSTPTRAVAVADLDQLQQAQQRGERIEQRLAALGLNPGAFGVVMPVLGLARAGQPVIDGEWETIYDTLLYARKQLEFGAWRHLEQTQGLTLSPSHFQVGDDTGAPETARSLSTPFWLSTRAARRDWIEVLEARLAQEVAVVSGIETAVANTEELAMPLLRDLLIDAADVEGASLLDRAKWLTERLLLDFQVSGQHMSTRVGQAIETVQEMLFALRTGQLEQNAVPVHAPLESISAVTRHDGRIDLFGRGTDDVLWHRVWDGQWRTWRSLGPLPGAGVGFRPSDPVALRRGTASLELVVRGSDRVLWQKHLRQGWSSWLRVEDGLELVGNPALAARGQDAMDAFALRISDLAVMQRQFDGTTWSAWQPTGTTSSRSPTAAVRTGNRISLFVGMPAPALFQPLHYWWDGTAWQQEPLDNTLVADPAATARDGNRIELFQNRFGHLWQKSWDGTAWQPWIDLDAGSNSNAPQVKGTPSVYSAAAGTLDVFALRSGGSGENVWHRRFSAGIWSDWEPLPTDQLNLEASNFDEEWEWIGSYSTWRSAEFVRLYPENLLLPSLITHQTPAFQALVKQTRPTVRLTPAQACEQALAYSGYLRNVSFLEVGASCQVLTAIAEGQPCKTAASITRNLVYVFGRTPGGKVYWCSMDPQDRSGYAQSFWDEVPLTPKNGSGPTMKVLNIIGALPWVDRTVNQHHIYLFLLTEEPNGQKLKRIRFDLDRYGKEAPWEAEIAELADLPTYVDPSTNTTKQNSAGHLTILPVQSNSYAESPRLALHAHLTTFHAYIRPLNIAGDDWQSGAKGWESYRVTPTYYDSGSMSHQPQHVAVVDAAVRIDGKDRLVYRWGKQGGNARYVWDGPAGGGTYICDAPSRFRGALPGGSAGSFFLFYDEDDQTIYRQVGKTGALGAAYIPKAGFTKLLPHSGSSVANAFVLAKSGDYNPTYAYFYQARSGQLVNTRKFQIIPLVSPVHNIPCGGTVAGLQGRRNSIKQVYAQNKGVSAAILQYLKEAYQLVPQQLGLNQQSSREYVSAIDWFKTVYDYRAPQGERYIDYGLAIDAGLPETGVYRHPEDWLLDPLNPHAVALTRRYACTRFAIACLIRCCNEFADAEFTYDSNESLVRARVLYTTAMELCDTPEMRQPSESCDALLAALQIQPGEVVPPEVAAAVGEIVEELTAGQVGSAPGGVIELEKIKALVQSQKSWTTILPDLLEMKEQALQQVPVGLTTGTLLADRPALTAQVISGMLADPAMEGLAKRASEIALADAADWLDQIGETV